MGLWTGVGGKLEPGEIPLGGALREVREETGLWLPSARLAGTITWGSGGMYAFVADVPGRLQEAGQAPRQTREGLLAWRDLDWVLDPQNMGVARHVQRALPALLAGAPPQEHRFAFASGAGSTDWTIVGYSVVALEAAVAQGGRGSAGTAR